MKKFRKFINRLLHDKDDFHKDAWLKSKVEIHNYLLDQIIDLEKQIVPAKIRYFWQNKKLFLLRLVFNALIIIVIVGGVLITAWFFGFRYNPIPEKKPRYVVLYVTETTDTNYIKSYLPRARFVLIYPPDPHKDWEAYKEKMHSKFETPGYSDADSYKARRMDIDPKTGKKMPSQFWGRYQLGKSAREACHIGDMPWEEFSTNPDIQEGAFKTWIRLLYRDMTPYIIRYEGRFIAGHQITASGIISMAHNVGEAPTIKFLRSKGDTIPYDGDGVRTPQNSAVRFLNLGGYNLTSILEK